MLDLIRDLLESSAAGQRHSVQNAPISSADRAEWLEQDPFLQEYEEHYEEDWSDWVDVSSMEDRPDPATDANPPASPPPTSTVPKTAWYLGLDLGSTGISAVLLDGLRRQLYPVYWSKPPEALGSPEAPASQANLRTGDRRFRLPMTAVQTAQPMQIKPYLHAGVPYYSTRSRRWEPVVAASGQSLLQVRQNLQIGLSSLREDNTCGALGLNSADYHAAVTQLAGIIVGYPTNWSDTYCFNVREAILQAGLIEHADQIFFLEDSIATLLSVLQIEPDRQTVSEQSSPSPLMLQNANWQGQTLILNAGATVTEFALVDIPSSLQDLSYTDFHLRSIPYAGNIIDQDIVCQLLIPRLQQTVIASDAERVDLALEAVDLQYAQLEPQRCPLPGDLDSTHRYSLQQGLEGSESGQTLLQAARTLKIAFQQQSRFTLKLGDQQWTIRRQDLGTQVLLPYVQRLNRELNTLLQETQVSPSHVQQVICTGGSAALGAIARWLRQKFPNATIIQDTYAPPLHSAENCIPSCSRVAYGLAVLPLLPQGLDQTRQQFNDYLLLLELLRTFPSHPVTEAAVMQRLQQRGIDTDACRSHILALLAGHLPPGLLPEKPDLFRPESIAHPVFQAIRDQSLFHQQDEVYLPNAQQRSQLQSYVNAILSHSQQTLTQPYRTLPHVPQTSNH